MNLNVSAPVITIGWLIALVALLLVFVFYFTNQLPAPQALTIGLVALARLL
jgi:hypothetical protein